MDISTGIYSSKAQCLIKLMTSFRGQITKANYKMKSILTVYLLLLK